MDDPARTAKDFLAWADDEGAAVALGAVLAELRVFGVSQHAAELLTVAESLAVRVAADLRTAQEWEARRAAARQVIRHADAEVRRAHDAEAAMLASARKRNQSGRAAMIQRAAAQLSESLRQPIEADAGAVKEAAQRLRSLAAMVAAISMVPAVLGDEAPGAALAVAEDTLAGIRDASRRDAELSGIAACLLEALYRGGARLDAAADDVAKMLAGRSITPRNEAPMLATSGTVKRWRERLPDAGPEARKRAWRQFVDWADGGRRLPYWLARTAHQLRAAPLPRSKKEWKQRQARLAVLLRAPANGDTNGWRLVAAEVRAAVARCLAQPPKNLTSPHQRERETTSS